MTERLAADVCIVGGGPAGAVLARRLAGLGHAVVVVERRAHAGHERGETLHAGAWPLLDHLGITGDVLAAGARPVHRTLLRWSDGAVSVREHAVPQLAVVRPRLDAVLLELARRAGAVVLQPAAAAGAVLEGEAWRIAVERAGGAVEVRARLLGDASGRASWRRGGRTPGSPRTFAMRGLWSGRGLPEEARVEAIEDGWLWGAPVAPGCYAAVAVVDAGTPLGLARYLACLRAAELFRELGARGAPAAGLRSCDATALAARAACGERLFRVGDASACLDPLSSAGLHAALGSALHAGAAMHTVLLHPARAPLACRFHEEAQRAQLARHRAWAAARYTECRWRAHPFWSRRAAGAPPPEPAPAGAAAFDERERIVGWGGAMPHGIDPARTRVALAAGVTLEELPCLAGDLIEARLGVISRAHDRPFVWVGGVAVAPLLAPLVSRPLTPGALLATWREVPAARHRELLAWLLRARLVHPVAG